MLNPTTLTGLEGLRLNGITNIQTETIYVEFTMTITLSINAFSQTQISINQINNALISSLLTCKSIFTSGAIIGQSTSTTSTTTTTTKSTTSSTKITTSSTTT